MADFSRYGMGPADILLPAPGVDKEKWAVIACDQFTSDRSYWEAAKSLVGDAPSTLNMIYPECFLSDGAADEKRIHRFMSDYLSDGTLSDAFNGFALVERQTRTGLRKGLVALIDLKMYDYRRDSSSLIRPSEGTVVERLPARMAIRREAPLELPHVMLLADDPGDKLIGPLYAARDHYEKLYDFDLMLDGGHIRAWKIADENSFDMIAGSLDELYGVSEGLLFAVGDGNHSLASARALWEEIREMSPDTADTHPARWALVEINNVHDQSLVFEPIHRAVYMNGHDPEELTKAFERWLSERGMELRRTRPEEAVFVMDGVAYTVDGAKSPLALTYLQPFLDKWLEERGDCSIDYIHDLDALMATDSFRIELKPMDKHDLFRAVRAAGALPRKTFSIGSARDKRYYLECRRI